MVAPKHELQCSPGFKSPASNCGGHRTTTHSYTPPYALQLASGWTRLTLVANTVAVVLLVPLMIVLTRRYGAVGAASVWVILNAGYVVIAVQVMHQRLLIGHKWRWYRSDVGTPLAVAVLLAGAARVLLPAPTGNAPIAAYLSALAVVTLLATAAATPVTRHALAGAISRLRLAR